MVRDLSSLGKNIRLILTDVDGVLTTGGVTLDNNGIESKTFSIRDGLGIRLWQKAGFDFGIVTGRTSKVVETRAHELDITILHQGIGTKLPVVEAIAKELSLELSEIAYLGDDLPDLPVIRAVGLGVAVGDAVAELKTEANYVTHLAGGHGAIRELVELILQNTNRWDKLLETYYPFDGYKTLAFRRKL